MVAGVMFSGDSWLPFATYLRHEQCEKWSGNEATGTLNKAQAKLDKTCMSHCVCVCAMCHVCAQNPVEKTVATRACLAAASGKSIVATLARHATSGQILYKLVTAGCKKTATSGQIPYRLVTASCKTKTAFFKLSSMWPYAFFYPSHCLSHHSTQFSASFNAAGCKSQGLQDMQITACTP